MATIERVPIQEGDEIHPDYKRCYVPGYVVKDACPKCGKEAVCDLGSDYLNYPNLNERYDLGMFCCDEDCGGEWDVPVILRMSVELAP